MSSIIDANPTTHGHGSCTVPPVHHCTCTCCKDLEKRDVNDIYGTYARGWDGEGEYGDGDKVFVSHSNPEYQSYDYVETDLDNRIRDQNSTYYSSK